MRNPDARIWIITGSREIGKTRFCSNLAEEAKRRNKNVTGIICPAIYMNQQKTGISVQNLRTNESYTLAVLRKKEEQGLFTDRWFFNPDMMEWGNQVFKDAIPCDLLIVDELGPLEFERGQGWQEGLKAVDSHEFSTAVVVIRTELIATALKRWKEARILDIPPLLDENNEGNLRAKIFAK